MKNRESIWITTIALCVAIVVLCLHHSKNNYSSKAPSTGALKETSTIKESDSALAVHNTFSTPAGQALSQLRAIFAQDPADENGRAAELLNQQCRDKHFQIALNLMDAVPRDLRADWLKIIFNRWAEAQPNEAMQSLAQIGDPDERAGAFEAAVAGWNSSDPASLANYAINQPASDDRDFALTSALENWSLQDPVALATWLNTLPRGAEFDYGAALMIAKTDSANRPPELAMKWVENIADPELKQTSFTRVINQWFQTDSTAAKQYVTTATWIDDSMRSKILSASR